MNATRRNAYLGGTAHLVLTALAKAGTATTRDLRQGLDLTPVHIATTLVRLRENGYATRTGTRRDGKHHLAVWSATATGRDMLAAHGSAGTPDESMALARIRVWLVKASRRDMNGTGAKVCAQMALDEVDALLGAREATGEEAA